MSNVMIVRHGQANSQARDEASYDQLSATGHQQAKWLGEYFGQIEPKFEKIYSGTLKRQIETAQGINQFGLPHPDTRRVGSYVIPQLHTVGCQPAFVRARFFLRFCTLHRTRVA